MRCSVIWVRSLLPETAAAPGADLLSSIPVSTGDGVTVTPLESVAPAQHALREPRYGKASAEVFHGCACPTHF